jgi:sulfate transport system ATP-binding protein
LLVTHDADEAMEIADGLVLMRAGRIEQTGTPLDVYDEPISPFALQLLGPANEISAGDGVAFVRPHDLRVEAAPFEGAHPARVSRLAELGSRTRLELALGDGTTLHADLPARTAAGLLVKLNALLYVAPLHQRSFPAAKLERTS